VAEGQVRHVLADRSDRPAELLGDPDAEKSQRVMEAMLKMKKLEIGELERAAAQA
jgi:hypothetical protein